MNIHLGSILLYFVLGTLLISLMFQLKSVKGNLFARATSQKLFYLGAISCFFTVILLLQALIGHDFSITYVYNNTSRDLPLLYLISAFWAGQEGSFLLWLLFLFGIGIVILRGKDSNEPVLMSVLTITQIFILLILCAKSPFARLWESYPESFTLGPLPPNFDGTGLNPLLMDPWMAVHPPVLFLGYAAAVVPFAYAIAALLKGEYRIMAEEGFTWVIFTLLTLGLGIFLGGYWAYAVLGWGGYWGWDPVENSSLVPWLLSIALLHGLIVQRRKNALVKTNLILAIMTFVSVFYSTFLTRSGVLSNFSVHSFGINNISFQIIYFAAFFLIIGLMLFFARRKTIDAAPFGDSITDTGSILGLGVMLIVLYGVIILIGTSMPILTGIFTPRGSAVTEGYYNTLTVPFAALMLGLIFMATVFRSSERFTVKTMIITGVLSLAAGIAFNIAYTFNAAAILITALACFTGAFIVMDIIKFRSAALLRSHITHFGVAVMVIGVIASSTHTQSVQKQLFQDREQQIGPIALNFRGITSEEKSSLKFTLVERRTVREIAMPYYVSQRMNALYKEPFIISNFTHDIYISPVTYISGFESVAAATLKRNEETQIGGLSITFRGFSKIDRKTMMSGNVKLYTQLLVKDGTRTYDLAPGLIISRNEAVKHDDAVVPASGRKISLRHINRESGSINIFVEPARDTVVPPNSVIVDISVKRFIMLVWGGTLLIAAGFALSLRKSS
ncbi:MAG TPA: cytochrome c biogenesis protein CcsA [Spirochaetota bacterium]|nr:cytochrome c biogenesis protein CcsA [Spirochaetota bacterium]HPQ53915.1 cytochrome c biogenesis protein CcsA [Spirochaetota bacterium]